MLNEARMLHRSERRRRAREGRAPTPLPADDGDGSHEALALVARLSPRQRAVVYLVHWEDLDPATSAELLGISEGSVRRHLARGLPARVRREDVVLDQRGTVGGRVASTDVAPRPPMTWSIGMVSPSGSPLAR